MNKILMYLIALFVCQSVLAVDCERILNERISPMEFYGVILSKKKNDETKTYIIEINNNNKIVILELFINNSSKALYEFSSINSMIKKNKNSTQISIANLSKDGSIEVQRFDISCEK